ncbi:MAG: ATP-grasp fold amidoligase family protein, partial [Methanogenium sp.]
AASRIGKFFQTFLRVDMYCSTEGIVFGELCCNPCSGRYFSDLTNKHFGKMWEQHLNPNAL